ncbi:unnamed protein product [Protopolystoma xenopodis]|uniref:Uncharacterized protein n=1 Tax=Protopolystoma xenopodis TaxID=117903 RepID=A0A448XEB4_9PLAT|nr:unnamed protein product [Protopolystoma xenopodis]
MILLSPQDILADKMDDAVATADFADCSVGRKENTATGGDRAGLRLRQWPRSSRNSAKRERFPLSGTGDREKALTCLALLIEAQTSLGVLDQRVSITLLWRLLFPMKI